MHGPTRLTQVQKDLKLSSSSVAEYHVQKLLRLGLIHEGPDGYVADKMVFESMIRVRRTLIPLWATFAAFLATSLAFLLVPLRPASPMTPSYLLSLIAIAAAFAVSVSETITTLRRRI
jgi:hypothetical protein